MSWYKTIIQSKTEQKEVIPNYLNIGWKRKLYLSFICHRKQLGETNIFSLINRLKMFHKWNSRTQFLYPDMVTGKLAKLNISKFRLIRHEIPIFI